MARELNNHSLLLLIERSLDTYVKANYSPEVQAEWEEFSKKQFGTVIEYINAVKSFPPFVYDLEPFSKVLN